MVILQNISICFFMIPIGFQEGICSLVGCAIGANRVALGKQIAKFTFWLSYACCMLATLTLYLLSESVSGLFSKDEEVKAILVSAFPILALSFIPDSAQGLLSGVVRALGV